MHITSMNFMKDFLDKIASPRYSGEFTILDVGSRAVDNQPTYKPLVPTRANYTGLDIEAGVNVDLVVKDHYDWQELGNKKFDVIISGQCLEHVEYPWRTMEEIKKRLATGGLVCIIVPSSGPEHRHPIDTYRFYPDGLRALCKWANLRTIQATYRRDGLWNDCRVIATSQE